MSRHRVAIGIVAVLTGCGASAIGAQADTIAVAGAIVAEADEIVVTVRARDLDEITRAAQAECVPGGCDETRSEHYRDTLAERERTWAPVLAARDLVVEALRAWLDGLSVAQIASSESIGLGLLLRLAARVASAYGTLVDVLATIAPDVHLPGLPGES